MTPSMSDDDPDSASDGVEFWRVDRDLEQCDITSVAG